MKIYIQNIYEDFPELSFNHSSWMEECTLASSARQGQEISL